MDGVTLLREARKAGLTVEARADQLVVRGPRRLADLAKRLLAHKPEVLAALRLGGSRDGEPVYLPNGWTPASWAQCLRQRAEACRALAPIIARRYREWADILDGGAERN